jgi:hypothetical protein
MREKKTNDNRGTMGAACGFVLFGLIVLIRSYYAQQDEMDSLPGLYGSTITIPQGYLLGVIPLAGGLYFLLISAFRGDNEK